MADISKLEQQINEFFHSHNGKIENGRMCLSVLCDSTVYFLHEMDNFLTAIGCTDIQTEGYVENDSVYGYRYKASGIMPETLGVRYVER